MGWYSWDPYQFQADDELTGLDLRILAAILKPSGQTAEYQEADRDRQLESIRAGTLDVAMGLCRTPERETFAYFSDPYRTETTVLTLPRSTRLRHHFLSTPEMLETFSRQGFRLGLVRGGFYGPEIAAFLEDPEASRLVRFAPDDQTNLKRLLQGEIDGFLADRLAAVTAAWRAGALHRVTEYPLVIQEAEVHAMFSKASCSPEAVELFNRGLREIRASGESHRIARQYGLPVLLGVTIQRPWFSVLDHLGVVAFAISGVLIARKERYDIFGAFVLALVPAAGGGVVRDMLTGRAPIGLLRSPDYLYAVLLTVAAGFLFYKITDSWRAHRPVPAPQTSPRRPLFGDIHLFFDAVGLAAFTIVGVVVAVEQRCEPLWLWGPLLAALTGAGGGILRDVLRADADNPSLKGAFYPEVALIWGFLLSVFLGWQATRLNVHEVYLGVFLTLVGALATRLLALRYGIRSPLFSSRAGDRSL